jgi:heme-degrading monooxygenase HmoA
MIVRMWKGWTANDTAAEAYEAFLKENFLPSAAKLTGFRGAHVLRRQIPSGETEIVTLTRFDSIEAVKAFAGEDYERARIGSVILERFRFMPSINGRRCLGKEQSAWSLRNSRPIWIRCWSR